MKFEKIVRKTQDELYTYVGNALSSMKYKPVNGNGFVYAEGDIPVMVVAHLDTVHKVTPSILFYSADGDKIMAGEGIGGDDRCGVYIIFKLLEKIRPYVLFVKDEEVGGIGSTAFTQSNIKPPVNYIVEFDRKGNNDAVFYDGINEEFIGFVESFGFKESYGSYTDICELCPYVKCAGVNLSSGYYNAHTTSEYVSFSDMDSVIERALKMIMKKTHHFKWEEAKSYYHGYGLHPYSYSGYPYYYGGKKYSYLDGGFTPIEGDHTYVMAKTVDPKKYFIYCNGAVEVPTYDCYVDAAGRVYEFEYDYYLAVERMNATIVGKDYVMVNYEDIDAFEEEIEVVDEQTAIDRYLGYKDVWGDADEEPEVKDGDVAYDNDYPF